jgi:hypothetical protein
MVTITEQMEAAEAQLRDAMLAGNVKALDTLLADDLVFTNQVGQCLTKADDLAAHSSGRYGSLNSISPTSECVRPKRSPL